MRGSNTLFADIFVTEPEPKQKKGRNKDLNDLRNECLIDRYFYYGSQGFRYDAILDRLGREFFISTFTIPYIIGDRVVQLKRLKEEPLDAKSFRQKWPHLSW